MNRDYSKMSQQEIMDYIQFVVHFNVHYKLLVERYKHLVAIDRPGMNLDISTYQDMIVVQIRAMFIESANLQNNYTGQNLLRILGEPELAEKIDTFLDSPFNEIYADLSIRKALKTMADKFICHNDNFDGNKVDFWGLQQSIESQLRNPYIKPNLFSIMDTLISIVGQGLNT